MLFSSLIADVFRVSAILGFALAAMPLLRGASSSARRLVLALALSGALVLPIVSRFAPSWDLESPAVASALHGVIVLEPAVDAKGAMGDAPNARIDAPQAAPQTHVNRRIDLSVWFVVLWGLGVHCVLARLAVGIVRARALVREATTARAWSNAILRAEQATGARASVKMTSALDAPAVTGVLRPVVLVPPLSETWSENRKYAVLLHELAHVRNYDCLIAIIAQLACAVHWFNPLAWLAVRRLRLERELAADDAVIAAGERASTYAEDLMTIANVGFHARSVPSGALGMAESPLTQRIHAIVSPSRVRNPLSRRGAWLLGSGAAIVVLGVACAKPNVTGTGPANASSPVISSSKVASDGARTGASSIDPKIQAIADEEVDKIVAELVPATTMVLVLDPKTGEILANAGRDHGAHADVAVRNAYITGSTIKAVTLSAALDEGVLSPTERIDCERGAWTYQGKVMHDSSPNGVLSVSEMLAVSTNIGFSKVFDRLGGERLTKWLVAFHFGSAPPVEGATAGTTPIRIVDKTYEGAVTAIGEGITASPLQVAAAYAAIANGGSYVAPTAMRRTGEAPHEQIMKPETARTVVSMLEEVVNDEHGTGHLARIPGVRVAGKTGTAGWDLPGGGEGIYASFVGFAPALAPRYVVLVGVEQPRDGGYGGKNAAPVFGRVMSRILGGS